MRLTTKQLLAIKESFKECFSYGDRLFLFGSRVDDSKKGGDIDLYIETDSIDASFVYPKFVEHPGAFKPGDENESFRRGEQKSSYGFLRSAS